MNDMKIGETETHVYLLIAGFICKTSFAQNWFENIWWNCDAG